MVRRFFILISLTVMSGMALANDDCSYNGLRKYMTVTLDENGATPLALFNARRLLSVNTLTQRQIRRLEVKHIDSKMKKQIRTLQKDMDDLSYPKTKANDDPALVSTKIKTSLGRLIDSLQSYLEGEILARNPNQEAIDDRNYAVKMRENLESTSYWIGEFCNNGIESGQDSTPGAAK